MNNVQILVGNQTYDISNNIEKMYLGANGLGVPSIQRYTQSGPLQQGATDIDFRIPVRNIGFTLIFTGSSEAEYESNRELLRRMLKPRRSTSPMKVRYTLANGKVYQIDCQHVSNTPERIAIFSLKVEIILQAADPFWYNPEQQIALFVVGANGSFTFPITFPVTFGSSTVNATKTVEYLGDWQEYPEIQIVGPITNPVITNLTTGEKLDFTGTTIANGDYYIIDTRYGAKTVYDSSGANKLSTLTSDSDLETFHLEPSDDDLYDGNNDLQVTGTSATSTTAIYIRYYERYTGI